MREKATIRDYASAAAIARRAGRCKRWVHRLAAREGWPCRHHANRREYLAPAKFLPKAEPSPGWRGFAIAHRDLALLRRGITRALALIEMDLRVAHGEPVEKAIRKVERISRTSGTAIRRWQANYQHAGMMGLMVERKRGKVGRKRKTKP